MTDIREFLNSGKGKAVSIGAIILGLVVLVWSVKANWSSEAENLAGSRMYIEESGKTFRRTLKAGDTSVVMDGSGKATAWPAEPCYWTKEGQPKKDPTWVLLNGYLKKSGPTFCPDCARLVVPFNPPAVAGQPAPPTQAEYARRGISDREQMR